MIKLESILNKPVRADCIDLIPKLPPKCIQTVVTSPPFYGKRFYTDYEGGLKPRIFPSSEKAKDCKHNWNVSATAQTKMATVGSTETKKHPSLVAEGKPPPTYFCEICGAWQGWLGLEPTVQLFVDHLVMIFREIRRILRDDGTIWVNMGDAFAGSGKGAWNKKDKQKEVYVPDSNDPITHMPKIPAGFKATDLMMVPARLAIALQEDGWYLRSEIIWHKPAPMPEGVSSRPSRSHEQIFLLSKNQSYYYDNDAIREPYAESSLNRYQYNYDGNRESLNATNNPFVKMDGKIDPNPQGRNKRTVWTIDSNEMAEFLEGILGELYDSPSVWTVDTRKSRDAHSAGYPTVLIEPCIKAGSSHKACGVCRAPYERIVEIGEEDKDWQKRSGADAYGGYEGQSKKEGVEQNASDAKRSILKSLRKRETVGWRCTCKCPPNDPVRGIVFDPFGGTGTTAVAAMQNGRDFIICDMSKKYCDIMTERLKGLNDQYNMDDLNW